jgi:uncharacterized protein YqeY
VIKVVSKFCVSLLGKLEQCAKRKKHSKQEGAVLTDDEETTVILQKEAKRRKEAIELFKQGKRDDLVAKDSADLAVIYEYIPKEMSREEIEKVVNDLKAKGATDFNSLMRDAMKEMKGPRRR